MNDDRISRAQLDRLTVGRDPRAAHAIDEAVRGVNSAEAAIRQLAAKIRAALDAAEQRLDQSRVLNDHGELQQMPADFDRAVILRQRHWQVLDALLTPAEIAALQPATH